MVQPFLKSPLGGYVGIRTATIYRINAAGIPVVSILELGRPFSPDKVGMDVVDSEDFTRSWSSTDHAMQDFTSATSNVHKNLDFMSVTGTLISSIDIPFIGSIGIPGIPGGFGGGLRADLLKMSTLYAIGEEREAVMVATPRRSMPRATIESIGDSWGPDTGENTVVTILFKEQRIVSPLGANAVLPDVAASFTGNNAVSGFGTQAPSTVGTQTVGASGVPGVAPFVVPIA
jgi:hypothetical protein